MQEEKQQKEENQKLTLEELHYAVYKSKKKHKDDGFLSEDNDFDDDDVDCFFD